MDQFMIDVTDIPDAAEGDIVTLIGREGDEGKAAGPDRISGIWKDSLFFTMV